jgi:hypothetical protein
LDTAPDDFKVNLAQSLRARGALISGHPCEKLKPTARRSRKQLRFSINNCFSSMPGNMERGSTNCPDMGQPTLRPGLLR